MGLFDDQTKTKEEIGLRMLGCPPRKTGGFGPDIAFGADKLDIQNGNAEMNAGVFGGHTTNMFGRSKK